MQRDDLAATRVPTQSTQDADDFVDSDVTTDPEPAPDLATVEEPPELDERSKRILAFERQWWRQAGSKEQAVRDTFNLSATRYYQLLNTLLDDPLALAHDPIVVQRLRRLRASRSRRH
ncbi:DUF3263 domain-containing protein [Dactylosporangium sp. NPDC005555]|uniref:DUF3263 domain-containing protein n=1 Tax=Dactylosporangium sp. NPDC005555 TaxID=3154889 RepID=UPI0033BB12A9